MSEIIRILPLGGQDEDGKNCLVVEINEDIFVIGCGVTDPDKTMPGVDYVIPRYDYLQENKDRIKAYILLHGHDDEVGGLAYIYADCPAPVYGSKVTLTMLKSFTHHIGADSNMYKLEPIPPTCSFKIAGRQFHFFHTAHNVADSSGLAIETELGNLVFTGDYVVENTASSLFLTDMNAIAALSERKTLALLPESIYAERSGYTAPNYRLTPLIEEAFKEAEGRLFISLSADNLFNFDEIKNLAIKYHRRIIAYDESTQQTLDSIKEFSQLSIPEDNSANKDALIRLRDQDILVLILGYKERLFRKIALLGDASNEDKRIYLKKEDTFVMASPPDDNTEVEYSDAADTLYRTGCRIFNISRKAFLRMHASEEDLKMMASILKPAYYIPVRGFYKDLLRNAKTALSMGIGFNHNNVFVVENGTSIILDETGGRIFDEAIPHGNLMIDGASIGDISPQVLEDREKLADGVAILSLTISKSEKKVVAGPEVQLKGLVYAKDAENLIKEASKAFLGTVNEFLEASDNGPYNLDEINQNAYERTLRTIRRLTGKDPLVIPLIVEIP